MRELGGGDSDRRGRCGGEGRGRELNILGEGLEGRIVVERKRGVELGRSPRSPKYQHASALAGRRRV